MSLSSLSAIINLADETRKGRLVAFDSAGRLSSQQFLIRQEAPTVALRCVRPSITPGRVWDDVDLEDARAAGGVRLGIGEFDKAPTSGTWGIAFDGNSTGLTALGYDISAADLLTALNANATVTAAGGIASVTKSGRSYRLTFTTVGDKAVFTEAANDLLPLSSIEIAVVRAGTGSVKEIVVITVRRQPYAYCDSWTAAAAASVTVATAVAGGSGSDEVQTVTLTPGAYGGSYSLTLVLPDVVTGDGSGTTTRTIVLLATDTADDVLTKLQAHAEAVADDGTSNLAVSGSAGGPFTISFVNELGETNIAAMTGADIDLLVPLTLTGVLDLANDAMAAAFEAVTGNTLELVAELEIEEPGEKPFTPYQDTWKFGRDIISTGALMPAPSSSYPLPGVIPVFRRDITALTGGTSAALDAIVTATGAVQCVIVNVADAPRIWGLFAGTDAEDAAGGIVRPDDYDGSTNAYVWKAIL